MTDKIDIEKEQNGDDQHVKIEKSSSARSDKAGSDNAKGGRSNGARDRTKY